MDQALEVDGCALDGQQALEGRGGGANFVDGVTRGDRQHVPAGRFLFADGGFGEQVVRERLHGGAALAFLDFGAAGSGLLSGSSHKDGDRLVCTGRTDLSPQTKCTGPMGPDSGSSSL